MCDELDDAAAQKGLSLGVSTGWSADSQTLRVEDTNVGRVNNPY